MGIDNIVLEVSEGFYENMAFELSFERRLSVSA